MSFKQRMYKIDQKQAAAQPITQCMTKGVVEFLDVGMQFRIRRVCKEWTRLALCCRTLRLDNQDPGWRMFQTPRIVDELVSAAHHVRGVHLGHGDATSWLPVWKEWLPKARNLCTLRLSLANINLVDVPQYATALAAVLVDAPHLTCYRVETVVVGAVVDALKRRPDHAVSLTHFSVCLPATMPRQGKHVVPEGESLLGATKVQLQDLVSLLPKTLVHLGLGIREMDDEAWKTILERFQNLERLRIVLGNPDSSAAMTNQVWYWLAASGRRLTHLDVHGIAHRRPAVGTRMWTPEALLELAKLPNMRRFAIVLDRCATDGSTIRLADIEALCTAWRDLEHFQFNLRKHRGEDMPGFLAKLPRPSLVLVDLGVIPPLLTNQDVIGNWITTCRRLVRLPCWFYLETRQLAETWTKQPLTRLRRLGLWCYPDPRVTTQWLIPLLGVHPRLTHLHLETVHLSAGLLDALPRGAKLISLSVVREDGKSIERAMLDLMQRCTHLTEFSIHGVRNVETMMKRAKIDLSLSKTGLEGKNAMDVSTKEAKRLNTTTLAKLIVQAPATMKKLGWMASQIVGILDSDEDAKSIRDAFNQRGGRQLCVELARGNMTPTMLTILQATQNGQPGLHIAVHGQFVAIRGRRVHA